MAEAEIDNAILREAASGNFYLSVEKPIHGLFPLEQLRKTPPVFGAAGRRILRRQPFSTACYGTVPNGILDASFGPAGELATCGRDGTFKPWSPKGEEEKTLAVPADAPIAVTIVPTRVAISHDGKTVLAGDSAGRLHTWPSR